MTIEERRFEHYTEWLLKAGANPEIVAMPAIQELIKQLISMGDPCVVFEGRSPISYEMPREDGTFDIAARTNGPCVTIRYIMSYCDENNPNNYIQLKREDKQQFSQDKSFDDNSNLTTQEITYIDKNGHVAEQQQYKKIRSYK